MTARQPAGAFKHFSKTFFRIIWWILALTAAAKTVSLFSSSKALIAEEPFSGMSYRFFIAFAASFEILVMIIIGGRHEQIAKTLVVLAFGLITGLYRILLRSFPEALPCPCIGTLTEWIPLSPNHVDLLLNAVVIFMIAGSTTLLIASARRRPMTAVPGKA